MKSETRENSSARPGTEVSSPPVTNNSDATKHPEVRKDESGSTGANTGIDNGSARSPKADEPSDEDLRIIPPEVVSGAYLTCADIPPEDALAPGGFGFHGCAAFDHNNDRVKLDRVKKSFTLYDDKALPVKDAEVVELTGRDEDIIWKVREEVLKRGVKGSVQLYDAADKPVPLVTFSKREGTPSVKGPAIKIIAPAPVEGSSTAVEM